MLVTFHRFCEITFEQLGYKWELLPFLNSGDLISELKLNSVVKVRQLHIVKFKYDYVTNI